MTLPQEEQANGMMHRRARSERPGLVRSQNHIMSDTLRLPTRKSERLHVHATHGEDSWQAKFLAIIHSPAIEYTLLSLLVLDVVILFIELYIGTEFPSCFIIERDAISCCPSGNSTAEHNDDDHTRLRWLTGDGDDHHSLCEAGIDTLEYPATCDPHKYPIVHPLELSLRIVTLVILSIFFIELIVLACACGIKTFLKQFWYVFDFVVVSVSLSIEFVFLTLEEHQLELALGLLIISRLWRFVRIGHGLVAATHELTVQQNHAMEQYIHDLEQTCKQNGLELPERKSLSQHHVEVPALDAAPSDRTTGVANNHNNTMSVRTREGWEGTM